MYKLLIVDDEVLIRRGIKSLADLSSLGIDEVYEAGNGFEALAVCDEVVPDLVLVDINMSKMDGLTFVKELKRQYPAVRVCMLTGYDYFDYAVEALRIGVDDYILKPIDKEGIEIVLRKMVSKMMEDHIQDEIIALVRPEVILEDKLSEVLEEQIFSSELSLAYLADLMGYSTNHLSTLFKQKYGAPFQDYVIKRRMEKAKVLLLTTEMKNYEISVAVGIEDVNYFATRFKKTYGMTPKQFKNQVKGL